MYIPVKVNKVSERLSRKHEPNWLKGVRNKNNLSSLSVLAGGVGPVEVCMYQPGEGHRCRWSGENSPKPHL